ncbi:MAG: glycosyltransferase family 2 protein [Flavobacteriaceae bacterium]|nr:glycosyltransferase family 2 protein [Flavobacteriaceae bacterium]
MQFSIILPIYNSEKYLEETFQSIANQKFTNYEVIAVDDNSTDESFETANALVKKFGLTATLLKKPSEIPQGVAATRNIAIQHATGNWLVFMDSDDIFHPEKLNCLHQYLISNTEARAVCHSYIKFSEISEVIYPEQTGSLLSIKITLPELISGNTICTSTVALSRQLMIEAGEFNTKLNGVEDYYQWLKVLCITPIFKLEAQFTYYRTAHPSLMGKRKLAHYVDQNHKLFIQFCENQSLVLYRNDFYETLFYKTMNYYISNAQQDYGAGDVLNGIFRMIGLGYYKPALRIVSLKVRAMLLTRIAKLVNLLRNKIDN